jgi:hypothetical protein
LLFILYIFNVRSGRGVQATTATCHTAPEQSGVMTDTTPTMKDDRSSEETNDPLYADRRNFYKVERWSEDDMRVVELLYAGNNLDKARRIFDRAIKHRPRIRLVDPFLILRATWWGWSPQKSTREERDVAIIPNPLHVDVVSIRAPVKSATNLRPISVRYIGVSIRAPMKSAMAPAYLFVQ